MDWIEALLRDSPPPPPTPPPTPPPAPAPAPPPGLGPGVFGGGYGGWCSAAVAPGLQQMPLFTGQWNCAPVSHLAPNMVQNLRPAGFLNGQPVWMIPAPQIPTVSKPKKRKRQNQQNGEQPPTKKPLNAFMLFLREQRKTISGTGSAAVNKILGERWQQLSDDQQAQYFEQVRREARLHNHQEHLQPPAFKGPSLQNTSYDAPSLQNTSYDAPSIQNTSYDAPSLRNTSYDAPSIQDTSYDAVSLPDTSDDALSLPDTSSDTPSLPEWSQSTHCDGESYTFDDLDQLASVFDGELAEEDPNIPDCVLEALQTPCLPDSIVVTPSIVEPEVLPPSLPLFSPSTELELQDYSSADVDLLVLTFESELAAVIPGVSD